MANTYATHRNFFPQTRIDVLRSELDTEVIARDNLEHYEINLWVTFFAMFMTLVLFTTPMFADELNSDIMSVLDSSILRGNMQFVTKYSGILAWGAQAIITACGFFIISLKTITIAFTLLYLTHPQFWNKVHDIKEEAGGRGDWLGTIVSWLTPDVKAYSEYGQVQGEDAMYDIGGIQTIGTYVRKNAVQFIVLITLASILWSGKLLVLLGKMSQGCEAVVDWALNVDYGGSVKLMLESDRDYQFVYDQNKQSGRNKQAVAKALYSKVKTAVPDNNTSEFYNEVGKNIENIISGLNDKLTDDESSAKYVTWDNPTLQFSITWNSDLPPSAVADGKAHQGVIIIRGRDIIPTAGVENITSTQMTMGSKGGFYLTFKANQTFTRDTE